MHFAVKKSTALVATAAAIGFSSLFMAAPANAVPVGCTQGATLLAGNVCELSFTAVGTRTFTPSAEMSQLEALLVAGGGSGASDQGYGAGPGGGGEVKVIGFTDTSTQVTLIVGDAGQASSTKQGADALQVALPGSNGLQGSSGLSSSGGTSGNGNVGSSRGGGGAGGSPANAYDGGAGVTGSTPGSLFSDVTTCYGAGGAGTNGTTIGSATCGAGYLAPDSTTVAAVANSGGGGAGGGTGDRAGASGRVVLRWALDVTASFDSAGHGSSFAPQTFLKGGMVTWPTDPTATGFAFNGWYTDAALTKPAVLSAPINASTIFYASWRALAPVTVAFDGNGHGGSVASQTFFEGEKATKPVDPTATGYVFNGWYTDTALRTLVDFTAPVTASTTFHAAWSVAPVTPPVTPVLPPVTPVLPPVTPVLPPVTLVPATPAPTSAAPAAETSDPELARTGAAIDPSVLPAGLAALGAGIALLALRSRRVRRTN